MRQILIAMSVVLGVVLLRIGFVYFQYPAPARHQRREASGDVPAEYMSPHLRILMFYSAEATPKLGEPATIATA